MGEEQRLIPALRAEADLLENNEGDYVLVRKAADHIENLEAQNLALIERNEKLEFREMELREALTKIRNLAHLAWTDEKNIRTVFEMVEQYAGLTLGLPDQRTGESE